MFGKKKKLDEKAIEYIDEINKYVDSCTDDNILNLMFTEITILRMQLDKYDNILDNIRDAKKRKELINKKTLIKVQVYDICEDYHNYKDEQKKHVDDIMLKILPKKINKSIWDVIKENIDNATGKHQG